MNRRTFTNLTMCWLAGDCSAQDRGVKPQPVQSQPNRAVSEADGRRMALVIGNDAYLRARSLKNAVHDASDLGETLRALHFEVRCVLDADRKTLQESIDRFASSLQDGDIAIFYFSGHGIQIEAENYLVAIDSDPASREAAAKDSCFRAVGIVEALQKSTAAMNLIVLDACRNDPFREGRPAARGLAMMEVDLGSYIALAAGPGQTASDNISERNGLFTKHLLQEIRRPGQALDELFGRVKKQVFDASKQTQRPWLHSDLIGDFYFNGTTGATASVSGVRALEKGKRLFESKQFDQAKTEFEYAMRVDPENPFIYNALGSTYVQLQQWSIATGLFAKAIELKPTYAAAYFNRGLAYTRTSRYELALQDFTWAVDEEPYDPLPLALRGKTYFSLLEYENAKADFNRVLELDPADVGALVGRGKVYFRQGRFAEAIADLTRALAIHSTGEAYETRSQAFRATNRTAQAEADHQAALRLRR